MKGTAVAPATTSFRFDGEAPCPPRPYVRPLRGGGAVPLEPLVDHALLLGRLALVLLVHTREVVGPGHLRRGLHLRLRLHLDRVHVGEVLDQLFLDVARWHRRAPSSPGGSQNPYPPHTARNLANGARSMRAP